MNKLPLGWVSAQLGLTGEYINGFAFKDSDWHSSGKQIIRIQNLTNQNKPFNRTTLQVPESVCVQTGDILVSWSATLDAYIWQGLPAVLNQHIFKVVPDVKVVEPSFLFHLLRQTIGELCRSEHLHGSTMKHINRGPFLKYQISLPPRKEQILIANAIDEEFVKLDAGVRLLESAQRKLVGFRASVLQAAVEGRLVPTEAEISRKHKEMTGEDRPFESGAELLERILKERRENWEAEQIKKFEIGLRKKLIDNLSNPGTSLYDLEECHGADIMAKVAAFKFDSKWKGKYKEPSSPDTSNLPTLPEGWAWTTTEQIAAFDRYSLSIGPFGSNLKVPDYRVQGVPLVFVRHIRSEIYTFNGDPYVDEGKAEELLAHQVDPGDLLITKMGDPPGDVALYPEDRPRAVITADCIRFKVNPLLNRTFVLTALRSVAVQRQIQRFTTGVAQQKVSLEKFRQVCVPLPSRQQQDSISFDAESLKDEEGLLWAEISEALKLAGILRQAVLKAAFEGKLVRQDPTDEPASALLERIKAGQETRQVKPDKNSCCGALK